jgi:hypothetical protein
LKLVPEVLILATDPGISLFINLVVEKDNIK